MINQMSREACKALNAEVEQALKAVAERHGLSVTVGGGTYDAGSFKPKVEFTTADAGRAEWTRYARIFGLPADGFGKTIDHKGTQYRMAGIAVGRSKFPVKAERVRDGKMFGLTVAEVAAKLPKAEVA